MLNINNILTNKAKLITWKKIWLLNLFFKSKKKKLMKVFQQYYFIPSWEMINTEIRNRGPLFHK